MKQVYLDNAATTKPDIEVIQECLYRLENTWGNPSSAHLEGVAAAEEIKAARTRVAALINADHEDIIFTSGGSEANEIALTHTFYDRYIYTPLAHDSAYLGFNALASEAECMEIPVMLDGLIDMSVLEHHLDISRNLGGTKSTLASFNWINNETGIELPMQEICSLCKEHGVTVHVDATQAVGCVKVDVKRLDCDFLSFSAHKINGLSGCGCLYVRDLQNKINNHMLCLSRGGLGQEYGVRPGTENLFGIMVFGEVAKKHMNSWKDWRIPGVNLIEYTMALLEENEIDFRVNGRGKKILNIHIPDIDAETLVIALAVKGVCVSAGSACREKESKPSRVLKAMGFTDERARQSIRISVSTDTTINDIKNFVSTLKKVIHQIKDWEE